MEKESHAQRKKKKKNEGEGSEQGGSPHDASNSDGNNLDEGLPENEATDSQDEMSDLEDLPEYERELILAKRHEEHMIKEHRRILLKKVKPQPQVEKTDQDDDANYVVQGGKSVTTVAGSKAALGKAKKKVASALMDKANVSGRSTKEGATAEKKKNKQSSKTGRGGTTASSAMERDLHRNESCDEIRKGKDSSLSPIQEKEATKWGENEKSDYQADRVKSGTEGDGVKGKALTKVYSDTADSSVSDYSSHKKKSVKKGKKKKERDLHTKEGVIKHFDVTTSEERNDLYSNEKGEKREDWNRRKKVLKKGSHLYERKKAPSDKSSFSDDSRDSRYSHYSRSSLGSRRIRVREKKAREGHTQSRSDTKDHHEGKKLFEDSKDGSEDYGAGKGEQFAKETITPERLIQLYKEEKKIKLEVYKYITYEIITYFQLKKTFLLDMSEHVNFPYHVIGHLVKVNDANLLVKLSSEDRIKNDAVGSSGVGSKPLGGTADGVKNAPTEQRRKAKEINAPNEEVSNTTTDEQAIQKNKKNIYFITNVIKSENYFCIDRHTNVKFELAHLENIENVNFFSRMKNQMVKNKKIYINEVTSPDNSSLLQGGSTFLCDLNNICDQKFSVDEYNCIKLFSIDLEVLKNFHQFLREKIEDLKNFRYTERQIEHLVEMKKKQSFHEIFSNKKSLDALPISRVTVQREICSIQREIDTLNYSKRKTNPRDLHALSQLEQQIDALTRKKDILKGQLQKARTNLAPNKNTETVHHERDKNISKVKPLKNYRSGPRMEELPHKLLGVEERKGISQLANYIHEEKKSFINFLTGKFVDLPLHVHNKIVSHFLLGCLQKEQEYLDNPPEDSSDDESGEDYHLFGVNIAGRVTPFEELKQKNFN
ncbi:conserved Plasmodium protein, unknown function [Plasmodium knowlesi strain H]|uniref:Uncharacterized protein n=3 Tax=Plasmodium knowlesi TaxID=5850 RepID=A0A5K1UKH3_PLAKH|nr:conserved Plasmodium protein, unknown function [Plasmodium knowlesi strain H]OTN63596.1 Uncharacterized protein PKNOH_S140263000 [Plasmodium knowlesi]CAA9991045.1 conserved Plasmodium protein, unknown function [Plasmodium knowlesi strain H]SBO20671.1 conserved Plasmodium protein, unknown function [Plasmodium knowlesi strain H]SBO21098.1 conserved Plasmodium protein, unknown function [Plasmodium knowlesi strain H]VVS80519.1 conserved Plasmodium protein, unknown function [Plasmodium knowlesi |eukprot:XP_002262327.1 hypothetical protein, conserved in Plasmodium species [Plasmodium knowlesi strain H]